MKDQLGRNVELKKPPQRIISIVPSQTELLYDLGLDTEVVGITKFCIHPEKWFQSKTRVGGTKQLNLETIRKIQPDLIIANKEENTQQQLEILMKEFPVWISDIKSLNDAYEMIEQIGVITNRHNQSVAINQQIKNEFSKLENFKAITAAYFIWNEPLMTIGNDTFINEMMKHCCFKNVFEKNNRYPEITESDLQKINPELILLSSEPYPFKEKNKAYFQNVCPQSKVLLVDGEMFSWYGSRLIKSPASFIQLRKNL